MIDKASALKTLSERLVRLPVGHGLELRSYKRDRWLLFVRQEGGELLVREEGFTQAEYRVPEDELRPLLKTLLRREFPRSTKLRLYNLGSCAPQDVVARRGKI